MQITSLYIVATPIGNLQDITLRALETLKNVDFILAEDTRVTKKLLTPYKINKKIISFHHHSKHKSYNYIEKLLKAGKNLALVSDSGTPGISDPGNKLVEYVRNNLPEIKIVPIPGPSALVTALSISGIQTDKFTFLGFPPHKKGRDKFFNSLTKIDTHPIVLYESKYRLLKTLGSLSNTFGGRQEIIITNELTKMFEKIYSDNLNNLISKLKNANLKGEFIIIVK